MTVSNTSTSQAVVSVDWGDGSDITSNSVAFSHNYASTGIYSASLAVVDEGAIQLWRMTIDVFDQAVTDSAVVNVPNSSPAGGSNPGDPPIVPMPVPLENTWSQSTDNSTIVQGSASCLNNPAGITDNSYWRLYDPAQFGRAGAFNIDSVRFGIENANTMSGMQLVEVVVHDGTGFPVGASSAPILGSASMMIADTDVAMQTFETLPFSTPIAMSPGQTFSVEVKVFNGQPQGDFFFIGSNTLGEMPLDSSFLSAPDCGAIDPVPTSSIGFDVDFIIDVNTRDGGPVVIGSPYCPNNPNSTGVPGQLVATGSTSAAQQNVLLSGSDLPPMQFGFFIGSDTQGFIANPGGSLGNICVLGNQGRYNDASQGQILNSGASGAVSLQVGNINVPTNPAPGQPILAGETWNWQLWYRDIGNTNNFTNAWTITFN
ncbi:MAG: hypothetical protein GY708_01120 [Actinomycetia bacterium]|nr:hypothetical protein [Actinomycetes bacterium]